MGSTATINLRVGPRRLLSRTEAAAYVGLPASRFERSCPVQPVELPGALRAYDLRDLDAWIDSLKAGHAGAGDDEILGRLG